MTSPLVTPRFPIRNIVVPTDFSTASEAVLHVAAAWAAERRATLHIVHFIPALDYVLAIEDYAATLEALTQVGREGLARIATDPALQGVPHRTYLEQMEVADGLNALVASQHGDLIMVASAGKHGVEKVLLGSCAEKIFRTADCPVLLFGPRMRRPPAPGPLRNLVLAVDFGPATEAALAVALGLARDAQAQLHLLHVQAPGLHTAQTPSPGSEWMAARLRALVPAGETGWEPTVRVQHGTAAEVIAAVARELAADLVVLGVRRPPRVALYTGWATAYQVLGTAPCPVLTVREGRPRPDPPAA
ncbi:MAG TPA: universal stress protein [Terriglobales bacterium]|nr:universal stress protein [Terriglobales bacterium]